MENNSILKVCLSRLVQQYVLQLETARGSNLKMEIGATVSLYFKSDVNAKHGAETLMDLCIRSDSHKPNTIDPETLPIVQELRKELELVTRERDEAVSKIESIIAYGLHLPNTCPFCKNEQCKMRGGTEPYIPKWRGIQEVQEDKQL